MKGDLKGGNGLQGSGAAFGEGGGEGTEEAGSFTLGRPGLGWWGNYEEWGDGEVSATPDLILRRQREGTGAAWTGTGLRLITV